MQDFSLLNKPTAQLLEAIGLFDAKKFTEGIKYLKENSIYTDAEIKAFEDEYARNTAPRQKTFVVNHTVVINC